MSNTTLELPAGPAAAAQWAAVAFVASYSSPGTRQAYTTQLRLWFDWCDQHHLEPLSEVRRPHVELYARDLEGRGLAAATVALKLVVLTGFYRYCVEEQLLEHSPAVHVRRPKTAQESTRLGLDRSELGAFLVQAGLSGGNDHALACLLALNALRVSEACGADLADLALANGHRTLRIVGKGNQPALIPLAPRTARAIDTAVGERTEGPLLARDNGSRLDRHAAGRIVRRLAKHAGIDKPISPHSLRHAAITAALDAGCSLRDVQDFARHADLRQTRRYDRARGALDRNPTYIVATYLAGATGALRPEVNHGCRDRATAVNMGGPPAVDVRA
jgi:integrase/recombinase XerD